MPANNKNNVDQKKVDHSIEELKSLFNKEVISYMRDSERSKNTQTESIAVAELDKKREILFNSYCKEKALTDEESVLVWNGVKDYFDQNAHDMYRRSIAQHPRAINNKTPYNPDNVTVNDFATYISNAQSNVKQQVQDILSKCAQQAVCPDEQQFSEYIDGAITRAVDSYLPDNTNEDEDTYFKQKVEEVKDECVQAYRTYANTVTVTKSFPKSDTKKENNTKKAAAGNYKNGALTPSIYTSSNVSFSGCDMVITAEMVPDNAPAVSVVMGEVQTISYSIYRKLSPILNIGNINAKDYVGGPRTIAGSIVFTVFNQHWGTELINKFAKSHGYPASHKILMDEVAPINLTISMANEYGIAARLAIYSVRLFSEGQVMSINDIYTENTYQYVALNIDYLVNVNLPDNTTESRAPEIEKKKNQTIVTPKPTQIPEDNNPLQKDEDSPEIKHDDNEFPIIQDNNIETPIDNEGKPIDCSKFKSQADCEKYAQVVYARAMQRWKASHPSATAQEQADEQDKAMEIYKKCINNIRAYYEKQADMERSTTV